MSRLRSLLFISFTLAISLFVFWGVSAETRTSTPPIANPSQLVGILAYRHNVLSSNYLVSIDQQTGEMTELRTFNGYQRIASLTYNPQLNVLFAIGWNAHATQNDLITIDFNTGNILTATRITLNGQPSSTVFTIEGLDYNPNDGLLYATLAINPNPSSQTLLTIDPSTGVATTVQTLTGDLSDGDYLVFANGELFVADAWGAGVGDEGHRLYKADLTTGVTTLLAMDSMAKAYNPDTDRLLGNTIYSNILHSISPSDGTATAIGSIFDPADYPDYIISGMAIVPSMSQQLYVFAFDNRSGSAGNLTPYYEPSIRALVDASILEPTKRAIVLVDLDGMGDTQILVIQNGQTTVIDGLPDATGQLDTALDEYNTANGEQVGWFIKWARDNYLATQTTFTYVGHGAPLAPETNISSYITTTLPTAGSTGGLPIIPMTFWTNPDWTDVHTNDPSISQDLISPYDLAQALEYGTSDGANPIDVVDVAHCFGASIEELTELSNIDGAPYAETIIASPNYRYFSPDLFGEAFATTTANMTSAETASAIIAAYDTVLTAADNSDGDPDVEHPRIIVAVDSASVPAIKTKWDELSDALMSDFQSTALLTAYNNAAKYDTSYCENDWELDSPDALVDMSEFATELANQYGPFALAGQLALDAELLVNQAVITRTVHNGTPWFDTTQSAAWNFTGAGISLFANFVPSNINGVEYLSWQADWYTSAVSTANPQPYQFVQANNSWADVLDTYWTNNSITSNTVFCLAKFPPTLQAGELTADAIWFPLPTLFSYDNPTAIAAKITVTNTDYVINPQLTFIVTDTLTGQQVFTDTVGAGYLPAGEHLVYASTDWIPTSTLPSTNFEITVIVDPDGQFTADDSSDNTASKTFNNITAQPVVVPTITGTVTGDLQWVNTTQVNLDISTTNASSVRTIGYQYGIGNHPNLHVADWFYFRNSPAPTSVPSTINLAQAYRPLQVGHVMLQLWAMDGSVQSPQHLELEFNYAPANAPINAGEQHFFLYDQDSSMPMSITVDETAGNVATYVWSPNNPFSAQVLTGTGIIPLDLVDGKHVVMVEGISNGSTYTISSDGVGGVGTRRNISAAPTRIQRAKPQFVNAIPDSACPTELANVAGACELSPTYSIFVPIVIQQ
ncbi:MAG: hypothetical protein ACPG8W_00735 [Candidatus Promineifilaceae bacterium]